MKKSRYKFTKNEWNRTVGYGEVPPERQQQPKEKDTGKK